jgi:pyrroline-5-carboxylate reductase
MPRDIAYKAILDVLEGTAILLKNRDAHPAEIRDEVTTPGGTTIRGLAVMESKGVKSALMETVEAAYRRSSEIGVDIDEFIRKELNLKQG